MLKLSRRSDDPVWLDLLPGVRIRVKPVTVAMMMIARRSAIKALDRPDPGEGNDHPPLTEEQQSTYGVSVLSSLVHQGVVEWEGIGDADGNPAPVSPSTIDDLLDVVAAFDAFDRLYYVPALARGTEKNG